MVVSGDQHLTTKEAHSSPIGYMLRKTAIVTIALTVGGASWYYAVGITSGSDLTAIYNCSAFFAYAFSIPILGDKFRIDKALAVLVAIAGVMTIAYGDSKSTGEEKADNRLVGNIVIGIGSVLYGLYEVLYKKLACPPDGVSPGRGAIFANTFGSLIGCFTLLVLWIPLPILHFTGAEVFEWPPGKARWMLFISTFSNACKRRTAVTLRASLTQMQCSRGVFSFSSRLRRQCFLRLLGCGFPSPRYSRRD